MSIHPTALVDGRASIGRNVSIGAFTIVHANVEIDDGTTIGSHCEIGHPAVAGTSALSIGPGSLIRSHSIFYEGSKFGAGLATGHRVVVRDGTVAGPGFQIGTGGEIQGDCEIGEYTRFQSDVVIGRKSKIGDCVWMFPRSGMLNDPLPPSNIMKGATIDDFAVISAQALIASGVTIGRGSFVGASTLVCRNVPEDRIVCGNPMADRGSTSRLRLPHSRELARPWTRHFQRGYPEHLVQSWIRELELEAMTS